jgi:hypothetical protein
MDKVNRCGRTKFLTGRANGRRIETALILGD